MAHETSKEEPSMEEILASIRRIISEDGHEGGKPEDVPPQAESGATEATLAPITESTDEVLELTEEVDDDGKVMSTSGEKVEAAVLEDPLVKMSEPQLGGVAFSASLPEVDRSPPAEPLMEVGSEDAAVGAFAALASRLNSGPTDQRITPGGRTIEDHVLEMLRPMLREWLDKHLPEMVERLVQREIDRIIHRSNPL